jgi:hypothetical protein
VHHALQTVFTFLVFVTLPTVFFFAGSFGDSVLIFKKIFSAPVTLVPQRADLDFLGDPRRWGLTVLVIVGLETVQYVFSRPSIRPFDEWRWGWRWFSYSILMLIFALLGNFGAPHDFIYRHF